MQNDYMDSLENLKDQAVVFWGTGRVAQDFYRQYCLEKNLLPRPIYWCDNAPHKQGTFLHNIEIISPEQLQNRIAAESAATQPQRIAIVIAATGINVLQIICQIEKMALKVKLYSAPQLQAAYYFSEKAAQIAEIAQMFADEKSREVYLQMIANMQRGRYVDFSLAETNQYLGNDVISRLDDEEVIVDAGVCNGEEIDQALQMNAKSRIYAFEPDHSSMMVLREKYQHDERVNLYEYALWNEKTELHFAVNAADPSASRLAQASCATGTVIQAIPLDQIIKGKISFIKMDIEGAEYKALLGAKATIQRYHPKLAICVYHNIEDYVDIPLLIKTMNPAYKFYFRQHSVTSGESVIYAL